MLQPKDSNSYTCTHVESILLSDSGMELTRLGEDTEVIVLSVGLPVNGRLYSNKRTTQVNGESKLPKTNLLAGWLASPMPMDQ